MSCSLIAGGGSSGCSRCENETGARGVVGVKSDCGGSGGGSSLSSMDRCVARRVAGLGAGGAPSEADADADDGAGDGEGRPAAGRSRRKGSGFAGVTGEFSTASRTGSKPGIAGAGAGALAACAQRRLGRVSTVAGRGREQGAGRRRRSRLLTLGEGGAYELRLQRSAFLRCLSRFLACTCAEQGQEVRGLGAAWSRSTP